MTRASSALAIRGLMLDSARLTERHDFYFDLLPRLAAWGYNTIWLHFCDDEGCSIQLDCHPEFAAPHAFATTEIREWVAAAREVGIDVVPEVETLGHSLWITKQPAFEHLLNGNPHGHNAICPSHPETLPLMTEIIREVADLFPSPYLHAGLDEAVFHDCPRCQAASEGKPDWWLLAEHANAIREVVHACGKRMIMWADSIEKKPGLIEALPRDIVLAHWHYRHVPAERIVPSVEAGFEILCVSALSGEMPQPDERHLINVNENVELAAKLAPNCLGSVTCWWESFRILRDTYAFPVAFAGAVMQAGAPQEPRPFLKAFLAEEYGLTQTQIVDAFWTVYERTPGMIIMRSLLPSSLADLPETLRLAGEEGFAATAQALDQAAATLIASETQVSRHGADYAASILAARIVAGAYRSAARLLQAYTTYRDAAAGREINRSPAAILADLQGALALLQETQAEIHELAEATSAEWDRTRYPDDPKKDNTSPLMRQRRTRAILGRLLRCDRFLQQTIAQFESAIQTYEDGGPLPGGV